MCFISLTLILVCNYLTQYFRRLGDEMRSFSQEKSRQKEDELRIEVERIQAEIKLLQKSSEDGANISEKLNKEVNS